MTLRIGLVVNPLAGLGGAAGLKGSDGASRQQQARDRGGVPRGMQRAAAFLQALDPHLAAGQRWLAWQGLGAHLLAAANLPHRSLGQADEPSSAADTRMAVQTLCSEGVDLLLFVGGDGTARDVLAAAGEGQLVLGVPAGVKMHSGVFAVSPQAAARVVDMLINGGLVAPVPADVVDYDDRAATDTSADTIAVKHYGELKVPEAAGFLQHTKQGGRESEPLALEEICADVVARLADTRPLILGPGGTVYEVKQALGLQGTLRGFDILNSGGVAADVSATALLAVAADAHLLISFTRGQGFLLGRGNQQLSPAVLAAIDWPARVNILASRSKLLSLQGRPLLIDTGSPALDDQLSGLHEIVTGYEDRLVYQVQAASRPGEQ